MAAKLFERLFAASFRMINRRRVWHRLLPFVLSVANLAALRSDLRRRNLFDTETSPPDQALPGDFDVRHCRTADGSFNNLSKTWMGMAQMRFGRNAPLAHSPFGISASASSCLSLTIN
jgi:hypothetical protein